MNVRDNDKPIEVKLGDIVEYDGHFFLVNQCVRNEDGHVDGVNLNGQTYMCDIARKIESGTARLYSADDYEIKIVKRVL